MLRLTMILLLFLLPVSDASAQQASPDISVFLQQRLDAYNAQHPEQALIVVTDKNVYARNEMLWFAGYILSQPASVKDTATVLIATWVDDVTNKVLLQKKFPIQNEFSTGNFLVPDSTMPGAHHVIFSTDLLHHNNPIGEYSLPLSVKTNLALNYTTELTIPDSLNTTDKTGVCIALIPTVYKQLMPGALFTYRLKGQKQQHIELNKLGKGVIYIDKKQIASGSGVLYTTTRFKDEEYVVNIKLPAPKKDRDTLSVRFYPEGGDLVSGLRSRVICEVRTGGDTTPVSATLLRDGTPLFPVSINASGTGDFTFRPQKGSRYTLQVICKAQDHYIDLPPVLDEGIVIHIPTAVIHDSLHIEMQSNTPRNVTVTMHNTAVAFSTPQMLVKNGSNIVIPIKEMKGIYAITVFDDKARPLAERLIFARYDQKNKVDIFFNKELFSTRDSVHTTLQISGPGDRPTSAVLTVSCVAMNRIATDTRKDLESVYYLERELDGIALYGPQGRLMDNKPLLEEALLLRGWRRYKWQQLQNNSGDTAKIVKPEVKGRLLRFEKKVKKPEELMLMKDEGLSIGNADQEGNFILSRNDLLVKDGRKLFIKVIGENKDGFRYEITDSLTKIAAAVAGNKNFEPPVIRPLFKDAEQDQMNAQERGKTLEAVVVHSKEKFHAYGTNECGDYVCQYNILNCINHPFPFSKPIVGNTYRTNNAGTVLYQGCKNGPIVNIDYLIYQAREFYGMDSALMKQDTEEIMSTIYWKPLLYTNASGKLDYSFFTADLKGAYLLTIQGIAADGSLIFGQKLLRVQ